MESPPTRLTAWLVDSPGAIAAWAALSAAVLCTLMVSGAGASVLHESCGEDLAFLAITLAAAVGAVGAVIATLRFVRRSRRRNTLWMVLLFGSASWVIASSAVFLPTGSCLTQYEPSANVLHHDRELLGRTPK